MLIHIRPCGASKTSELMISPAIPLGQTGRDDNHVFTAPNSEIDSGAEGKVPEVQSSPARSVMVLVHPG